MDICRDGALVVVLVVVVVAADAEEGFNVGLARMASMSAPRKSGSAGAVDGAGRGGVNGVPV